MRLRFTEPAGYRITTRFAGSDESVDSDPAIASGLSLLFSADRGSQLFTDIDAGIFVVTSLS